jgi:hypothetical protein
VLATRSRDRLPKRPNTRLLNCLRAQGRSTTWFCRQMNINRSTLWRVEQGLIAPPADWYQRAAAVLGVNVDEISPAEDPPDEDLAA